MVPKKPKRPPKVRNVMGGALRAARKEKGLSQAAMAAKLQLFGWDIDRTSWVRIEKGERTLSDCELVAIADVLGTSIDAIISGADRKEVRRILQTVAR